MIQKRLNGENSIMKVTNNSNCNMDENICVNCGHLLFFDLAENKLHHYTRVYHRVGYPFSDTKCYYGNMHDWCGCEKPERPWKMPEWMEIFRDYVESGCGGNTAEELLNRKDVSYFNNCYLYEFILICKTRVTLLEHLKKEKLLSVNTNEESEK